MMDSSHHYAAFAPGQGGKLVLRDVASPVSLRPYEMLVDVKAVSINPVDWKVRDLGIFNSLHPAWPKILGVDAAGTVLTVGSAVHRFKPGDRVAGYVRMNKGNLVGSFQQKATLWEDIAVGIPADVSFQEAATLPLAYSTAVTGLRWELKIGLPGEEVPGTHRLKDTAILVLGGATAIGQCAVQLLWLAGWTRIITTASIANRHLVEMLGAHTTVDYHAPTEAIAKEIEDAAGGKVGLIYDTVSTLSSQEIALRVVDRKSGKIVLSGPSQVEFPLAVTVMGTFGGKVFDATASAPLDGQYPEHYELGKRSWTTLHNLLHARAFNTLPVQLIEGDGDFAARLEEGLLMNKTGKLGGRKAVVLLE